MTALPADIAKFTNNGIVVRTSKAAGDAILAAHPNARSIEDGREIEMFFTSANDAQALLDERFALTNSPGLHDGVEVEDTLGLGTTIPLAPVVPCFTVIDQDGQVTAAARTRSYARSMVADRYAVEALQ